MNVAAEPPEARPNISTQESPSHPLADKIARVVAPSLLRYSLEARQEHASRTVDYFVSLEELSRVIAKQKQSDDVQASHVRLAAEALGRNKARKLFRRAAEIGVLFAGAGLGYLGNVLISEAYTFTNAVIFGVPILVGVGIYFYAVGQD
jgi:hypothetical protein